MKSIEANIVALVRGPDEAREAAVDGLIAAGEAAIEPLIALLASYESWEAYAAAPEPFNAAEAALIAIGTPAVLPLIAALRSERWGEEMGAISCLGELGDPRAIQPLIERLDDDRDRLRAIGSALAAFGAQALRPLIYALAHGTDSARRGAAHLLGQYRDPLAASALIAALGDLNASVRAAAAGALAAHVDARAVEPLIDALSDEDPAVRENAVRALGETALQLGGQRPLEALRGALTDLDWGTRQSAAEMLARLGVDADGQARALLEADLRSMDAELRLGAAWSLLPLVEQMPELRPQVAEALAVLLYHVDARISASAALALGELGDRRAVWALRAAQRASDSQLRHAAQHALDKLGCADDS
ncbi:MAG: HEAT repeat domain-containing protein [Aggregatilineales bacterium]